MDINLLTYLLNLLLLLVLPLMLLLPLLLPQLLPLLTTRLQLRLQLGLLLQLLLLLRLPLQLQRPQLRLLLVSYLVLPASSRQIVYKSVLHACCYYVDVLYRHVQYHAMIGGPSTLRDCGTPKSRDDDVIVEYSINAGVSQCYCV